MSHITGCYSNSTVQPHIRRNGALCKEIDIGGVETWTEDEKGERIRKGGRRQRKGRCRKLKIKKMRRAKSREEKDKADSICHL